MSDKTPVRQPQTTYIETPRGVALPEKISSVLEQRMKEFMRKRRSPEPREVKQ